MSSKTLAHFKGLRALATRHFATARFFLKYAGN